MIDKLPAKHLFFTGKGGVGKTTVACALAVQLAEAGQRVLLISTDPASNISQVLQQPIGAEITNLQNINVKGKLDAIEIDPDAEAKRYRETILAPVRNLLPPAVLKTTEETLSGSCTVEVASFNRFTDFLTNEDIQRQYDRIIFDTAPTGHTIRLLSLPGDWASFIDTGQGDASCLGPMSGLEKNRETYHAAVAALADPRATNLVMVARAQRATLKEASRSALELASLGIKTQLLIINGTLPAGAVTDNLTAKIYASEQHLLETITQHPLPGLEGVAAEIIELQATSVMGVEQMRSFGSAQPPQSHPQNTEVSAAHENQNRAKTPAATKPPAPRWADDDTPLKLELPVGLDELINELAQGEPKLVLCMGKGGVGKTTVAQAVALGLARAGKPVHLSTTDPAAHLDEQLANEHENLTISSIDPQAVVAKYRAQVIATKGKTLDEDGLAQLEEDLRSPCTEEVAVFKAFSAVVEKSEHMWVVLDTAPTGHTLLLLDATGSYHRELIRQSGQTAPLTTLQRLQNPQVTKPILVALPETTPLLEAQSLADDLARAQIKPWAWVINQTLAVTPTDSEFLLQRAAAQTRACQQLENKQRVVALPFLAETQDELGAAQISQQLLHGLK